MRRESNAAKSTRRTSSPLPFADAIRLALAQIRVQKLKSFFTLLGVTIGVMFLIAVVSIVEGMGNYMEHDFAAKLFGVNTFELRRRPDFESGNISDETYREWQRRPRIRDTDIEPVVKALPAGTLWSASGYDNVKMESPYSKPRTLSAEAVHGDYFKIRNLDVASGRLISPQEMELGTPVIVIGKEIADKFFPNLDPLGRTLRAREFALIWIGVVLVESGASIIELLREIGPGVDGVVAVPVGLEPPELGVVPGDAPVEAGDDGVTDGQTGSTLRLSGFNKLFSASLASAWLADGMPSRTFCCATGVRSSMLVLLL